ncbi:uncharacterized protein N0V89_003833 [Didymosphaeria variabile]|uniref:SAP domain-containing protein n=1 Tax=Didymosphaeria variabile TaxID=1932322 RepID=A0A9W9CCW5_9PLEO|nr:uncharacterized protein N0V89_003833 [Didymosphaeria variabile]KAJ4355812.1 hypothetical protein N0V89_003833 [Didymosphaeria variabile]
MASPPPPLEPWTDHPIWEQFKNVDSEFSSRWGDDSASIRAKPVDHNIRLRILLYAGRQTSASLLIASEVAEQGMLYEPFTYWDWHGYDSEGSPLNGKGAFPGARNLQERKRKRRVLWEREKAFKVILTEEKEGEKVGRKGNECWEGGLSPRLRWEGFKRFVEKKWKHGSYVKKIAVANWMSREDMEWIAKNLKRLEALDLSDVPSSYSHSPKSEDDTWIGYFESNSSPVYIDSLLDTFPFLEGHTDATVTEEKDRWADLHKHRSDYAYKTAGPQEPWRPHNLSSRTIYEDIAEDFEEFFWRLQEQQEYSDAKEGRATSDKLRALQEKIAETHLWRRLKWLGLPDWRSDSYAAKAVGKTIPPWCVSLKTVSVRGEYTRDRTANEIESVHHHVCQLILGIEKIVPASVTKLELRLSISFLRYFLEQLQKKKPTILRVGIDLGAWVQVFPLGNQPDHLKDEDIRATTRRLAHNVPRLKIFRPDRHGPGTYQQHQLAYDKLRNYEGEQEYLVKHPSFYRDRSGNFEPYRPLQQPPRTETLPVPEQDTYDFFDDLLHGRIQRDDTCPLDKSKRHATTKREIDRTRANTLPKLLEKLHLARHKVGSAQKQANLTFRVGRPESKISITRNGAHLFGLQGEAEARSFDPIDPLTLTQQEVKAGVSAGPDYRFWTPENLKTVYPWLEETFRWRPVFDWDWFMVPQNMSVTENPNLVTINRSGTGPKGPADWQLEGKQSDGRGKPGKGLESALKSIKAQFKLLNDATIPVHLLIGRRHPDLSSCYWGWPYTKESWKEWNEQFFSANLETIAEHVNTLSIFYDLRNPLDADRLSLVDAKRPFFPPEGTCPTRVCLLENPNNGKCPFVQKHPGQRNRHPRPQVSGVRKPPKTGSKKNMGFPLPTYRGLAPSDTSAPPTGEHADDEAKEDDSDEGDMETFPLRLARRSAYLRESVGWVRFWEAHATSFKNLTALHVRMPQCHDTVSSWRLARLLNRHNGWTTLTYTDERQHVQTEEDLLSSFEDEDSASVDVWYHMKESRVWPAGRFVRRSWVWDPLRLADERSEPILKPKEDPDNENEEPQSERVGKRYLAYRFEPRKRPNLASHDNNVEIGEIEGLRAARRDVDAAIAHEEDNGDRRDGNGLPTKPEVERITRPEKLPHQIPGFASKFKSVYGHHIRNVAGAQWREELRQMIAFIDEQERRPYIGTIPEEFRELKDEEREMERQHKIGNERDKLKALLAEEPPYGRIFEVKDDRLALGDVPETGWDGDDEVEDGDDSDTANAQERPREELDEHFKNKSQEGAARYQDPFNSSYPLAGSGETLPGENFPSKALPADSEIDTEVDSLFNDTELGEISQIPSSPPTSTSPQRKAGGEDRSPEHASPSPSRSPRRPPTSGPFDQSSSPSDDDGDEDDTPRPNAPPPNTTPAPKRYPLIESGVRPLRTPIDEDYTDNDFEDDDGNLTDTEGLYTSPEQSGGEQEQAQERQKTSYEKIGERKKAQESENAVGVSGDDKGEGMSFMEWLSQATIAANAFAANPTASSAGGDAQVVGPGSTMDKKRQRSEDAANEGVPSKKVKTAEAESKESAPRAEPAASSAGQKRKEAPSEESVPTKKTKTTRSGRPIKQAELDQPSYEGDYEPSDEAEHKPITKRTHSKANYVPSPTTGTEAANEAAGGDEPENPKEKKPIKQGNGKASAPAPALTPAVPVPSAPAPASAAPVAGAATIQVPSRASGEPDYVRLTVVNLRALARQRGVRLTGAKLKAEIIRRFEEDDAGRGGGGGSESGAV